MQDDSGSAALGFVLIGVAIVIYFVPAWVAHRRKHPQSGAIFVLDLCLGWTLVGWVAALVWANTNERPAAVVTPAPSSTPRSNASDAADIERFAKLRDDGAITDEEFEAKKRAILGL